MRKNKFMRAASGLLVAVLLTTCVISGTFAKYVTTNSGEDSARVAKFGVKIEVADDMDLFKTEYATSDDNYDSTKNQASVKTDSTSNTNVVAPGTSGSMEFKITGTPEVATKLDVEFDVTNTIKLDASTYTLEAGKFSKAETSVKTTGTYEPILWTLNDGTSDLVKEGTLSQVKTELNKLSDYKAPNTKYDKTYTLSWKWPFEGSFNDVNWGTDGNGTAPYDEAKEVDFLDTYLGDETTPQTEAFTLKITVTQVD